MDLYAIHKSFLDMQSSDYRSESPDVAESAQQSRSREEMARLNKLINMAIFKGQMINPLRPYEISFDSSDSSEEQRPGSTEFNPSLLLPFGGRSANNQNNNSGSSRVTLADQFTWGAVVCAGVFVVVFICVMAAWWVHKKQQARMRRRAARRQMAERPYCIENDGNGSGNAADIQRPPSYFEVIGFFDPPPSYNDVLGQAYDNVAVTIDELPPPFAEGDYMKSVEKIVDGPESAINTVSVIPSTREGHDGSDNP